MQSCKKFNALFSALLIGLLPAFFAACKSGAEKNKIPVLLSTVSPISSDTAVTAPTSYDIESPTDVDTYIILNNENTTINGGGVSFENSVLTISKGGTYSVKGRLSNGRIVVDAKEPNARVILYLNGVSVSFPDGAPIYFDNSVSDARLILTENTKNTVSDHIDTYHESESRAQGDFVPAAIFSKGDLTIGGTGSLFIEAKHGKGIFSSNDICIENGSLNIESSDDAVCGKNGLVVSGGSISAISGGSGLRTGDSDPGKGALVVSGGSLKIESRLDCIQSSSNIIFSGGSFDLTGDGGSTEKTEKKSGANSENALPELGAHIAAQKDTPIDAEGSNAVFAAGALTVSGGDFAVNSRSDAFNCGGRLIVTGGSIDTKTDRTAFFSSATINFSGGNINTDYCLDGIEAKLANISGGNIYINARSVAFSVDTVVTQSGGTVVSLSAKSGVNGRGIYTVTGGTVFAAGDLPAHKATVVRNAELSSTAKAAANILLAVTDERGKSLFCLKLPRKCEGFWFSSPELIRGKSYNIYSGGINTGVQKNGIYQGSAYTPGTLRQTVTAR